MNKVESYQFGQVIINGKTYDSDVIIFPDRVQDDWHRQKSHELSLEEINVILAQDPAVIVIGTGAYGQVQVLPEVSQEAAARNIQLVVQPTAEACEIYNQLATAQRVVAALHLTC